MQIVNSLDKGNQQTSLIAFNILINASNTGKARLISIHLKLL